jgi:KTSC domain
VSSIVALEMPHPQRSAKLPAQPRQPAQPSEQSDQDSQDDQGKFVEIPLRPSSQIQSASYNATTLDLVVSFVSGAVYLYHNVDQTALGGWPSAESAGKYFYYNIRSSFDYERLD